MRIGIVTWWRANYGSVLQAYALQKIIKEFNVGNCEIIAQYDKKIISIANLVNKIRTVGFMRALKRGLLIVAFRGIKERNIQWEKFIEDNLIVSSRCYTGADIYETNKEYDVFLCGSDQIWNPNNVDLNSIYWLGFVEDTKTKIAYAPSVGITEASVEISNRIRNNLKSFSFISCRERSGTDFLNTVIGKSQCAHVLDPTLAIGKDRWDKLCAAKKYNKPYIFAYLLRGTRKQRIAVSEFARRTGKKLICIPFLDSDRLVLSDLLFGDCKYWAPTPEEFISLIRNADYVFTDSYHCSIFSCIYHRQFSVFPKAAKAQTERIRDLLGLFNLSDRIIYDFRQTKIANEIDEAKWSEVDAIIEVKRKTSLDYLRNSLIRSRKK